MLFCQKKGENHANISHTNRQKDRRTSSFAISVRYNEQFRKDDKKIH